MIVSFWYLGDFMILNTLLNNCKKAWKRYSFPFILSIGVIFMSSTMYFGIVLPHQIKKANTNKFLAERNYIGQIIHARNNKWIIEFSDGQRCYAYDNGRCGFINDYYTLFADEDGDVCLNKRVNIEQLER